MKFNVWKCLLPSSSRQRKSTRRHTTHLQHEVVESFTASWMMHKWQCLCFPSSWYEALLSRGKRSWLQLGLINPVKATYCFRAQLLRVNELCYGFCSSFLVVVFLRCWGEGFATLPAGHAPGIPGACVWVHGFKWNMGKVLIHLNVALNNNQASTKLWWALWGPSSFRNKGLRLSAVNACICPGYGCSHASRWIRLSVLRWQDNLTLQQTRFQKKECLCVCQVAVWRVCHLLRIRWKYLISLL